MKTQIVKNFNVFPFNFFKKNLMFSQNSRNLEYNFFQNFLKKSQSIPCSNLFKKGNS